MRRTSTGFLVLALLLLGTGCGEQPPGEEAAAHEPPAPITNRIDVPPAVRRNLGITFVEVAYRHVARTRRVPGRFEYLPTAHGSYHAALEGKVHLLVAQYQKVAVGDVLFRVDSPTWRELQLRMAQTVTEIRSAHAKLESLDARRKAQEALRAALESQRQIWDERLRELEALAAAKAGNKSARTSARAELSAIGAQSARLLEEQTSLEAEERSVRVALRGYQEATPLLHAEALCTSCESDGPDALGSKDLVLSRAAALLGVSVGDLVHNVGTEDAPRPRWRDIQVVEVKARQAGVVEALPVTDGSWVHEGDMVLKTVNPSQLRFRASGLQSDLESLQDGLQARIVPPGGRAVPAAEGVDGTLSIGVEADPLSRKIDLIITPRPGDLPAWARDGVSTEAEVILKGTSEPQLAIPASSVIQDGLEKIMFRRDPKEPDKVIRMAADLGLSDGRWVIVESGVMEGDQVVNHGVYELMLAGSSAKQEGGHFHADGTWHAGDDH